MLGPMACDPHYFVYMLASRRRGTLYTGVTNDLYRRVLEHRGGEGGEGGEGARFTARYKVHSLVWYEQHGDVEVAIAREKAIKKWRRAWKINLIEQTNPHWDDLFRAFE